MFAGPSDEAGSGMSSPISTKRYFFFDDTSLLSFFGALLVALAAALAFVRACRSRQNALTSSGLPSRKETSFSCSDVADLVELAVASTKSTIVGSEAPVRRRRESDTKVRLSIFKESRSEVNIFVFNRMQRDISGYSNKFQSQGKRQLRAVSWRKDTKAFLSSAVSSGQVRLITNLKHSKIKP